MKRTSPTLFLLLTLGLAGSHAQPPVLPEIHIPMHIESLVLPGRDATTWVIHLNYRIDREFFVPVRNTDPAVDGLYRRSGEILVELADSAGSSHERQIDRIDMPEDNPVASPEQPHWVQGTASFTVPPGTYSMFFEATDTESRRRQIRKDIKARTPRGDLDSLTITGTTFVEAAHGESPDTLIMENFGGDFLFGKNSALLVGLHLPGDTSTTVQARWAFTLAELKREPGSSPIADSLSHIRVVRRRHLHLSSSSEEVRGLLRADSTTTAAFAVIPMNTALLPLRDYTLRLDLTTAQGRHRTLSHPCRAVWPEMPFSLKNVDGALEALRFITTEKQLDSIRRGSFEDRRDALETFWRSRDRSPGTARNEVMAEYYRRVDHATRNFGTLRIPDGSRSDMGKIFILYGSATRTERSLNPGGGHIETWFYDRLRKKFVFVDQDKKGTYTLAATAPL